MTSSQNQLFCTLKRPNLTPLTLTHLNKSKRHREKNILQLNGFCRRRKNRQSKRAFSLVRYWKILTLFISNLGLKFEFPIGMTLYLYTLYFFCFRKRSTTCKTITRAINTFMRSSFALVYNEMLERTRMFIFNLLVSSDPLCCVSCFCFYKLNLNIQAFIFDVRGVFSGRFSFTRLQAQT